MSDLGICYCGAYGGGKHTKSARCDGSREESVFAPPVTTMQLASMIAWFEGDQRPSAEPVNRGTMASALRELERLRDEDQQWDKHSLVEIIRERDRLRAGLRSVIDSMARGGVAYQIAVKALHGESAT